MWKRRRSRCRTVIRDSADSDSAVVGKLKTFKSISGDQERVLIGKFRQLGLFSDEKVEPRGSIMKALSALLETKCQFQEGEVDILLLQHTFEIERADGKMVRLSIFDASRR